MTKEKITIKTVLAKINSIIATLSGIITIVSLFTDINPIIKYVAQGIIFFYLLGVIFYIIKSIFNTNHAKLKLEENFFNKHDSLAAKLHTYYHNLRNDISSIETYKISSYTDVEDKCRNICNYLSEFYTNLFSDYLDGNSISICIKLVRPDTIFDENYNNWTMETIARSASTTQGRNNIDRNTVKISENTDFQIILSQTYPDELFCFADMTNIQNDFLHTYKIPYLNSRGDHFLDYYRSTIVVPIKIDGRYISSNLKNRVSNSEKRDLVLGFLCIDSMKTFTTSQEKRVFSLGIEYAKSFGDSLYSLFEKVLISCLNNDRINKNVSFQNKNSQKSIPYNKNKKGGKRK